MDRVNVCLATTLDALDAQADICVLAPSQPHEFREDLALWVDYAKTHRVYLVTPPYESERYICLSLIDREGEIVYTQRAVHLYNNKRGSYNRWDRLDVIDTPFGKLALIPATDIYHPEVARAAAVLGAEILVACGFVQPVDFSRQRILFGPWSNAQTNCVYVLYANNNALAVIGPCNTTPEKDYSGFIAGPSTDCVCATIDRAALQKAHDVFPIFNTTNELLYQNHFDELVGE